MTKTLLKQADQARIDCLRLIRSENVGSMTFHSLISYYGSAAKALDALPALARRGGRSRPLTIQPVGVAEKEIAALEAYGARLICFGDDDYPALLAHTPDAPPVLTLLGQPVWRGKETLAIVGGRHASVNGCHFARRLAGEIGAAGYPIVSGLARGIDTGAHLGSLATGTIAVIAGGIDHIYPRENERLYHDIAAQGAILAEAPFGTAPQPRHFPARNRIIAGMSLGVVVMEASVKSGSLITANLALDYGREVFAVPGSPMDGRSGGCHELLRRGAHLTETLADIRRGLATPSILSEEQSGTFSCAPPALPADNELAEARTEILKLLGPEPSQLDELLNQCHITPHLMHAVLLELELAGRLIRTPGGRIALKMELE